VCDRIEVCDRKLASVRYQAPFDLLFTRATSNTKLVVAHILSYSNPDERGFASPGGHRRPVRHSETFCVAQPLRLVRTGARPVGGHSLPVGYKVGGPTGPLGLSEFTTSVAV
jgi:hypothetical protein